MELTCQNKEGKTFLLHNKKVLLFFFFLFFTKVSEIHGALSPS